MGLSMLNITSTTISQLPSLERLSLVQGYNWLISFHFKNGPTSPKLKKTKATKLIQLLEKNLCINYEDSLPSTHIIHTTTTSTLSNQVEKTGIVGHTFTVANLHTSLPYSCIVVLA